MATAIRDLGDIPVPAKKTFTFEQNGEKFVLEFAPLTAQQMEDIRADLIQPAPPEKPIEGLSAQEKVVRKRQGLSITYRDFEDPEYLKQQRLHGENFALEMVRRAMGSDLDSETFRNEIRAKLVHGTLQGLVDAVQNETFRLDSGLVENLSENSPQLVGTDVNS